MPLRIAPTIPPGTSKARVRRKRHLCSVGKNSTEPQFGRPETEFFDSPIKSFYEIYLSDQNYIFLGDVLYFFVNI